MGTLFVTNVFQYGPNGGFAMFQSWFWILLLIPILIVIFFLYRLFLPKLNKVQVTEKLEETVETKTVEESIVKDIEGEDMDIESDSSLRSKEAPIEVALRLLESDERKVIEAIIESGGSLLQKEISWKTSFSRVKTHRVLVRLIRRGVVTSEKYYNTNKISLSEWLNQKSIENK